MSTDHQATTSSGLTIAQTATRLDISENAVRQRIKRGTLDATKVDGQWRVTLADQGDYEAGYEATTGRDYQADHEDRPAGDYEADHQATSREVMVSAAARAQLAAIRDEFVQPLVDQIAAQAETIGKLTQERDQLRADLERVRATDPVAPAVDAQEGPGRATAAAMAPDTSRPSEVTLALRVRRWLRRLAGDDGR